MQTMLVMCFVSIWIVCLLNVAHARSLVDLLHRARDPLPLHSEGKGISGFGPAALASQDSSAHVNFGSSRCPTDLMSLAKLSR